MDSPSLTEHQTGDRGARSRGALAGIAPTLAIALLFATQGSTATPGEVAFALGLVAAIAVTAGWLAGPLAARRHARLVVVAIGYALALIATAAALSVVQGVWDAWTTDGPDPLALASAIAGRALYALAATLYLILPALALGLLWTAATRGLVRIAA
jgi:hypothetical protein